MIDAIIQRWNRWASTRMHMHFYLWEPVADRLGIDMVPIPAPASLERFTFWRFSFDS